MKKIIGYTIISALAALGLYILYIDIREGGWYFALAIGIIVVAIALLMLGLYLIKKQ
jgi:hypothetical protein